MATLRPIQERWHVRTLVYRASDAASIVLAWLLAARTMPFVIDETQPLVVACAILVFHFVGEITGMYRNWRGVSVDREVTCTILTWSITVPLVSGAASLMGMSVLPARFLVYWMVLALTWMGITRFVLRSTQAFLRTRGFNTRGYAIVGINDLGMQLARNIEESPEMGLRLVGFYEDRTLDRVPELGADVGKHVGTIANLVEEARAGRVSMIYITFPMRAEERIREVLAQLADSTASVYIVPDFFVFEMLHSQWSSIGGLPVVSVFENPFYGVDGLVKRTLDFTLALFLLILLFLPMSAIAVAVKATSRGPVFFKQRRYGLDGREILVWKFRSMKVCEDGTNIKQATLGDERITAVGRILRTTSLDELPQLFNVLGGSMSLVGPRPHASAHNESYRKQIQGYMMRHKVRPGITGLAQVSGYRGETDTLEKMQKRIEFDHRYIREWSVLLDLRILLKTILVVFSKQNAY